MILLLLLLFSVDARFDFEKISTFGLFQKFNNEYSKTYSSSEEYKYRLQVFSENCKIADELNRMYFPRTEFGITPFMTMTKQEFRNQYLLSRVTKDDNEEDINNVMEIYQLEWKHDIPDAFDWRDHGAVTQVRNQGECGSCYAFSVCGEIEGKYFLKNNDLVPLSPQMIVDCDQMELGCYGGTQDNAYWYIKKFGLETWEDYPYTGEEGYCERKEDELFIKTLTKYSRLEKNETYMKEFLFQHGPLSVLFDADNLQYYKKGIWDPKECDPTDLNHAVLITGYNETTKDGQWWTIKNSWGEDWGMEGYFMLARGTGLCGINQSVYSSEV